MDNISELPGERKCQRMIFALVFGSTDCPHCGGAVTQAPEYFWCATCRVKLRPKAHTWLKGSNLSYRQLLGLMLCWQKNTNPGSLKTCLGTSYTTAQRWYTRFRMHLPRDGDILRDTVVVDEAFMGRQKFDNQRIVVGAIEKHTNRLKLAVIPDRDQDTLELFILGAVDKNALIHTDAHASYYDLEFYGYAHMAHNHSAGKFGETSLIEGVWSVIKRQQRRLYGKILTKRLPEFIQEWEGRRNFPDLFRDPFTYFKATLTPCSVLVD